MTIFKYNGASYTNLALDELVMTFIGSALVTCRKDKTIIFEANGDTLIVDLASNTLTWSPAYREAVTNSKLSLRVNQWFAKGYLTVQQCKDSYPCSDHDCYDRGNFHVGCETCPKFYNHSV